MARPRFLSLSVALGLLGTSAAADEGLVPLHAIAAFTVLLLAHVGVNCLNEYFDFRSGVDLEADGTPFSGGSGVLPAGELEPGRVFVVGAASVILSAVLGSYLVLDTDFGLLPVVVLGVGLAVLYSPVLTRYPWPELSAGVGLGVLPVLGFYYVGAGAYPLRAVAPAVAAGLLVHNLLLLNEFPDVEADASGGRRTLPIVLGRRGAALTFAAVYASLYLWIVVSVWTGWMPPAALLGLLAAPLALSSVLSAVRSPDEVPVSALARNVAAVLGTLVLLGAGYLV